MGRNKRITKYEKEVYAVILASEHIGISLTNIAKELELTHDNITHDNIKNAIKKMKNNKTIFSKISLELNKNGDPDGRNAKYYASVFKTQMTLNSEQLALINKIRIGKKISDVGK